MSVGHAIVMIKNLKILPIKKLKPHDRTKTFSVQIEGHASLLVKNIREKNIYINYVSLRPT